MATAANVCDQAGLLAKILGEGETYSGAAQTFAFTRLQRLIGRWISAGYLEIPVPSTTSDTLNVSEATLSALENNLAVRLGRIVGMNLDPILIQDAKDDLAFLRSQSSVSIAVDMSANGLPVSRGRFDITSG